jgi:hypothetical protein
MNLKNQSTSKRKINLRSLLPTRGRAALLVTCALGCVTGCFSPKTHHPTADFNHGLNHYYETNTDYVNSNYMTELPSAHGWHYLNSELNDGKDRNVHRETSRAEIATFFDKVAPTNAGAGKDEFAVYYREALEQNKERFLYENEEGNLSTTSQPILFGNLKHKWAVQNFIEAKEKGKTNAVARVNPLEIYGASKDVFGSIVNSNLLAASGHATNSDRLNFPAILKGYFLAYLQGQFTERDGTVLGKPTVGTTNASAGTTVTIPDATESAIATVFMEALCDFGSGIPVFYQVTNSTTFAPIYVPVTQFFKQADDPLANILAGGTNKAESIPSSNVFIMIYTTRTNSGRNYFLGGKTPTAAAFLPTLPVVPDYATKIRVRGGLTAKEAQFIISVSSLTETETKALAGILIRSFGGASGGGAHFGFGSLHLSLGDNKVLAEILEDLLASSSYHTAQHDLTKVFWKYDGANDQVNEILNDFSSLLGKITSLQKSGGSTNAPTGQPTGT